MAKTITADALKGLIRRQRQEGGELALMDLREEGLFSRCHLFHARSLPLSRLELALRRMVPRRATPLVLVDAAGEGLAARAAAKLEGFGYSDVALLEGGVAAWQAAGYEVFSGVNVPSKAFGEVVEIAYDTPHLPAAEVQALRESGANMVILDSRPYGEFHRMSIPGGIDTPGAELAYRVHDLAPDPETLVVVNCAGRTRSIIGCQSLVNAGIPNRVAALKDGTMGWHLAGLELAHGAEARAPAPSAAGLDKAKTAAARVAARFGVRSIDRAELAAWQAEADRRSLYLLDVRQPEEYAAGHLPGSLSAPGGQLVQATDEYVGVLGARLVLIDDDGVRATMTASWLIQMGWKDVAVLAGGLDGPLETGPESREVLGLPDPAFEEVTPHEVKAILDSGEPAMVIDLATSLAYREGHIPGAAWGLRGHFAGLKQALAPYGLILLASADGALAQLAAAELQAEMPQVIIRLLAGGTPAWGAAGLPVETGMTWPLGPADDVWYKPYENEGAVEDEMRDYLTWEIALVEQVERDGDAGFLTFD
ncbi:MAG TPA: rhodanese-like domain-containing protein [Kiloniellaceae bacterium]|nr:rhodanese-like domain-containing protein [Kiloniellaceae bacterium]